jgi:hypothetical protein
MPVPSTVAGHPIFWSLSEGSGVLRVSLPCRVPADALQLCDSAWQGPRRVPKNEGGSVIASL